MAVVKIYQLRDKSDTELLERIKGLKKELYELRLKSSIEKIEKPHQFKEKKKEIAQILTLLKEKEGKS